MSSATNERPGGTQYPHLAWEAYVVGRYGPALGYRLDAEWDEATLGVAPRRRRWRRWRRWLRSVPVSGALRRLVLERVVEGAVLVETHRCVDRLRAQARRTVRARYAGSAQQLREHYRRAQPELDALSELTPCLLVPATVLRHWLDLGRVVGEALRAVRTWAACGGPGPGEENDFRTTLSRVRSAAGERTLECPSEAMCALSALAVPDTSETTHPLPVAQNVHRLHLELARANQVLACELRARPAPPPVLVLETDRLVFRGVERRLADLSHPLVALLWVLAEHANQPVDRTRLRTESGIQTTEDALQQPISRLRALLREIAPESGETTRSANALIRGLRSDSRSVLGPYCLALDPSKVQVRGKRPDWMTRE